MLSKLIIVRHGSYVDTTGHLSAVGQQQITSLGERLSPHLGDNVVCLSSTLVRARQTAKILIGDKNLITTDLLVSASNIYERPAKVLELIRSHAKQVISTILLVTHYEYTQTFPCYFAQHELRCDNGFPRVSLLCGEAWLIDCVAKTCEHVRREGL